MSDPRPTRKQREVLNFITTYLDSHGYSPSYREIGAMTGIKSVSTVSKHVDNLVIKGFLEKERYGARSITVAGKRPGFALKGQLEQGFERQLVEQVETRLLAAEQDPSKELVAELSTLLEALAVLGVKGPEVAFRRRLARVVSSMDEAPAPLVDSSEM